VNATPCGAGLIGNIRGPNQEQAETAVEDACIIFFCLPCAIMQDIREIDARKVQVLAASGAAAGGTALARFLK